MAQQFDLLKASAVSQIQSDLEAAVEADRLAAEQAASEAQDALTLDINAQTSSYTLALSDAGQAVEMNLGSAGIITVPDNATVAFPVGTQIAVVQVGAGKVTITPAAGVTVNTSASGLTTDGQWATAMLIKRGTDEWVAAGALSDAS